MTTTSTPMGGRVLVLEEHPTSRNALVSVLRMSGFSATVANSLSHASSVLSEHDVVLIDGAHDPHYSELLSKIASSPHPLRVALMSDIPDIEKIIELRQQRQLMLFRKPIDVRALIAWLQDRK